MKHQALMSPAKIVFPTSKSSWMKHATAVGDFVERLGPSAFTTGVLHKLFVGFRPMLLKSAIFNQHGSFLGKPEWTEQPFQRQPVSLTQSLFNRAVHLPDLLERFADTMLSPYTADISSRVELRTDLETVLRSLRDWETTAQNQSTSPLYWKKIDNRHLSACDIDALWFRDLMTATSLTFCWAFKIVVLNHLDLVQHSIDTLNPSHHHGQDSKSSNREEKIKLAGLICNSMPYFMRPEMKLWGHASTFFTFSTSVQTFKDNEVDCRPQLLRCQQIFTHLNKLKVHFPGIQELLF
ncbi:hypothetical protein E8E12_001707 [Didymella heteroderae]|uniref:Uncharacterized protein n=1 Tax=Didymella heteroderae TaxID=1769908 RepID=A0A9P4WIN9_9PLEO|nr:hypothetical protein E8E12_001707 [Didymella heteroderae]